MPRIEKTPEQLLEEKVAELARQLDFLGSDSVKEWKEKFPSKWEADVARIKEELSSLKPSKAEPKVAKKVEKKSK